MCPSLALFVQVVRGWTVYTFWLKENFKNTYYATGDQTSNLQNFAGGKDDEIGEQKDDEIEEK